VTYDDALAAARDLAAHMRARGVVVSIELQPGSGSSGWGGRGAFVAEMSHHTVSRASMGPASRW
jgi:cellulase/cellobiase CelA1